MDIQFSASNHENLVYGQEPGSVMPVKRVAAIQMVSCMQVQENLRSAAKLIDDAAMQGADLIVLPENFAAFANPDVGNIGQGETNPNGVIRRFLADQAARNRVWIVGGTIPTDSVGGSEVKVANNRVRAACFVYDREGKEVARYDKIHMFDVTVDDDTKKYAESETFEAGDRLAVVDTPVGKMGLSVCYDLRFPEMYRILFRRGAEILSVPSAFTEVTGSAHWEVLMRSRAIENFCYVVGACQGGEHDSGRRTFGDSLIIDPWGRILCRLPKGPGVILAEIDLQALHEVRSDMPVDRQMHFVVGDP
jgi:predicted amidohydrolase